MQLSVHSITVFTIPKIWKHLKYSTDKKFGIYTMDYYSAIKKSAILPFATMWMNLQNIMLMKYIV